jgi:hypothetical protein
MVLDSSIGSRPSEPGPGFDYLVSYARLDAVVIRYICVWYTIEAYNSLLLENLTSSTRLPEVCQLRAMSTLMARCRLPLYS